MSLTPIKNRISFGGPIRVPSAVKRKQTLSPIPGSATGTATILTNITVSTDEFDIPDYDIDDTSTSLRSPTFKNSSLRRTSMLGNASRIKTPSNDQAELGKFNQVESNTHSPMKQAKNLSPVPFKDQASIANQQAKDYEEHEKKSKEVNDTANPRLSASLLSVSLSHRESGAFDSSMRSGLHGNPARRMSSTLESTEIDSVFQGTKLLTSTIRRISTNDRRSSRSSLDEPISDLEIELPNRNWQIEDFMLGKPLGKLKKIVFSIYICSVYFYFYSHPISLSRPFFPTYLPSIAISIHRNLHRLMFIFSIF